MYSFILFKLQKYFFLWTTTVKPQSGTCEILTKIRLVWCYCKVYRKKAISFTPGSRVYFRKLVRVCCLRFVLKALNIVMRYLTLLRQTMSASNKGSSRVHPNHGSHKSVWQLPLLSRCLLVVPAAEAIVSKLVNAHASDRYPFLHKGLVKGIWEGFKRIIFVHTWRPLPDAPDCHMP